MPDRKKHLLILGGTAEAVALADAVSARFGDALSVTNSLAGRTNTPRAGAGKVRVGGFGGPEGLAAWLRSASVDMLIDATHPYASEISANASTACAAEGVSRLILTRPFWAAEPGDRWLPVPDLSAAASALPDLGKRIFLSVGSQQLQVFAGLAGIHLVVRMIDQPMTKPPLADYSIILGKGPFDEAAEIDLFRRESIDAIVSRNSGGASTYAKIAAARVLGLPVVMVAPPERHYGARVEEIEGALQWIATEMAAPAC